MGFIRCVIFVTAALINLALLPIRGDDSISVYGAHCYATEQKLKTIFVSIDFTNAKINEALDALTALSKNVDPEHRGISFLLIPDASVSARSITLKLDKVPVGVALHYVCELSRVRSEVNGSSIEIIPYFDLGDRIEVRTFHVDPSFFGNSGTAGK